ncbi:unnamed protein product, partial [Musa acuminata var. zebrina]
STLASAPLHAGLGEAKATSKLKQRVAPLIRESKGREDLQWPRGSVLSLPNSDPLPCTTATTLARTSTPSELRLLSASPSPVNDLDTNLCFSSKIEDRSSTGKQRQWDL